MKPSKGFTLIEVIVIITIMAIAAALLASYMGKSFTQSPASAGLVNNQYKLIQQMEKITSNYRQALQTGGGTLDLCTNPVTSFKAVNVDGQPFVDAANTSCTFTLTSGTYTTRSALLVTLTDGQQKLQSIFTQ
jgi:prepilin-type N-terminal cleavage/methylation domain-containing protein